MSAGPGGRVPSQQGHACLAHTDRWRAGQHTWAPPHTPLSRHRRAERANGTGTKLCQTAGPSLRLYPTQVVPVNNKKGTSLSLNCVSASSWCSGHLAPGSGAHSAAKRCSVVLALILLCYWRAFRIWRLRRNTWQCRHRSAAHWPADLEADHHIWSQNMIVFLLPCMADNVYSFLEGPFLSDFLQPSRTFAWTHWIQLILLDLMLQMKDLVAASFSS